MARPAAAGPHPSITASTYRPTQPPPSFPPREPRAGARRGRRLRPPPFPTFREPNLPPVIPAPNPRVIPAKAGTQRGAGRGNPTTAHRRRSPEPVEGPPTPRRRGLSRMARPAAAGPSPLHHHQHLPFPPAPTVVPAFAGTQGRGTGAGRPVPLGRMVPRNSPPEGWRLQNPFALSLSKGPIPHESSFPRRQQPHPSARHAP